MGTIPMTLCLYLGISVHPVKTVSRKVGFSVLFFQKMHSQSNFEFIFDMHSAAMEQTLHCHVSSSNHLGRLHDWIHERSIFYDNSSMVILWNNLIDSLA